jgi:hypothetical protein
MSTSKNYQRWFVDSSYQYASAPKLEVAVFNFARDRYLHTLVYEGDIPEMTRDIAARAELLHSANKGCKPVEVRKTTGGRDNDIVYITMGHHSINLRRVVEEFEIIPNDNILQL